MAEVFVGPDVTGDTINDADITGAGDFVNIGGVIFTDAVNAGSGTGNYNTFLAISNNSGVEAGFNSDDTPPIDNTNKDIDQAKTHTVLLSNLVVVTINGVQYYEIRLDLNEANSDPNAQISLDQFKLYTSTNGAIESTTTLFTQNLIYDMDAGGNVSVLLSDAGSTGSGTDDYAFLIPVSEFAGLDPTTTYVYLYTQLGAADGADWNAGATFEEFNLQNGATLTGTKFSDLDGDGVKDAGEGPVAGVTIFIDANQNGVLDAGERSTVTDANGNYTFYGVATGQTLWIDEVVPSGATQTTGDHETVVIGDVAPGTVIVVDPIGNHYLTPHVTITKDASVPGDCADTVGELITYTITVDNDGELNLTNVVLKDDFEGGGDVTLVVTGDGGDGLDPGEVVLTGDDGDGILETNETWTYTYVRAVTQDMIDSNGGDNDGTLDNTATVNADSVNGSVSDDDDASVDVCPLPELDITKDASVPDDCADVVGELVTYTVTLENTGNVALENVVLTDSFEGGGDVTITPTGDDGDGILEAGEVFLTGDTGNDGIMDPGEIWTYQYVHEVTQGDIDSNGGDNDGTLDNIATGNADAVTSGIAADAVSDDASVDVCQNPAIDVEKYVMTDVNGAFVDADDPDGPEASTSSTVDFKVVVTNTGNVTLTDITLSDTVIHTVGGVPGAPVPIDYSDPALNAWLDLNGNDTFDAGEEWTNFDTDGDGTLDDADGNAATVDDFILAAGDSFTVYYSLDSLLGQHENTVEASGLAATTADPVSDDDDANYYVIQEDCVGVRTPGFWANPKNGGQFWDGVAGNEKHAGEVGFADGELLYGVDSNHNGSVGAGDVAGLLIGDYNLNGITDAGEDTIFISLSDANKLINASNKQLADGKTADGIYMLGRDMVATWLNYLANNQDSTGNCIGDVGGATNTPKEYLDAAIDWMQEFASVANDHAGDGQTTFQFDPRVAPSSTNWQDPVEDIPVSAAAMHSALDGYNNTGAIGGTEYCCDADSEIVFGVLQQVALI